MIDFNRVPERIDEILSPSDVRWLEQACDEPKNSDEAIQQIIGRAADIAIEELRRSEQRWQYERSTARRLRRRNRSLTKALWAATGFAALMAIVAACAILWR